MAASQTSPDARTALLAGATGLVGRALLARLLESTRYAHVHALLRRAAPDLPGHPKLHAHEVEFARLPRLPHIDDVFIALGTTIKAAGSEAAFRRVDFDAVLAMAQAARAAGAGRLLVVSALGADPGSRVFYNRVKGEMERAVAGLGYESVVIARPSLLLGDRAALGQSARAAEERVTRLLRPLRGWLPRSVRPIDADAVARALLHAAAHAEAGVTILRSGDMQSKRSAG